MILFTVGDALDPPINMVPTTSIWKVFRVFDNLYMLLMGTKTKIQYHCFATTFLSPYFMKVSFNPASLLGTIPLCSGWGSRPTQIYSQIQGKHIRPYDNLHMIWIDMWPLMAQIFNISWNHGTLLGSNSKWYLCAVGVEAVDQSSMIPEPISDKWNMFHNLHMQWMAVWIWQHHTITAFPPGPKLEHYHEDEEMRAKAHLHSWSKVWLQW